MNILIHKLGEENNQQAKERILQLVKGNKQQLHILVQAIEKGKYKVKKQIIKLLNNHIYRVCDRNEDTMLQYIRWLYVSNMDMVFKIKLQLSIRKVINVLFGQVKAGDIKMRNMFSHSKQYNNNYILFMRMMCLSDIAQNKLQLFVMREVKSNIKEVIKWIPKHRFSMIEDVVKAWNWMLKYIHKKHSNKHTNYLQSIQNKYYNTQESGRIYRQLLNSKQLWQCIYRIYNQSTQEDDAQEHIIHAKVYISQLHAFLIMKSQQYSQYSNIIYTQTIKIQPFMTAIIYQYSQIPEQQQTYKTQIMVTNLINIISSIVKYSNTIHINNNNNNNNNNNSEYKYNYQDICYFIVFPLLSFTQRQKAQILGNPSQFILRYYDNICNTLNKSIKVCIYKLLTLIINHNDEVAKFIIKHCIVSIENRINELQTDISQTYLTFNNAITILLCVLKISSKQQQKLQQQLSLTQHQQDCKIEQVKSMLQKIFVKLRQNISNLQYNERSILYLVLTQTYTSVYDGEQGNIWMEILLKEKEKYMIFYCLELFEVMNQYEYSAQYMKRCMNIICANINNPNVITISGIVNNGQCEKLYMIMRQILVTHHHKITKTMAKRIVYGCYNKARYIIKSMKYHIYTIQLFDQVLGIIAQIHNEQHRDWYKPNIKHQFWSIINNHQVFTALPCKHNFLLLISQYNVNSVILSASSLQILPFVLKQFRANEYNDQQFYIAIQSFILKGKYQELVSTYNIIIYIVYLDVQQQEQKIKEVKNEKRLKNVLKLMYLYLKRYGKFLYSDEKYEFIRIQKLIVSLAFSYNQQLITSSLLPTVINIMFLNSLIHKNINKAMLNILQYYEQCNMYEEHDIHMMIQSTIMDICNECELNMLMQILNVIYNIYVHYRQRHKRSEIDYNESPDEVIKKFKKLFYVIQKFKGQLILMQIQHKLKHIYEEIIIGFPYSELENCQQPQASQFVLQKKKSRKQK